MSKGKIIAATILIILFAAFLFYRFFEFFKWQERKALGNGLSSYVLIGSKNIVVGKDIEPGYYDIKALEDHSGFSGEKCARIQRCMQFDYRKITDFLWRVKLNLYRLYSEV